MSLWIKSGLIIYVFLTCIDRFLFKVPNIVYIPAATTGVMLIFYG